MFTTCVCVQCNAQTNSGEQEASDGLASEGASGESEGAHTTGKIETINSMGAAAARESQSRVWSAALSEGAASEVRASE